MEKIDKLAALENAIVVGDVPQIAMTVISYALQLGSSDIHIEPEENTVRIRFRVDGVLRQIVEYPPSMHAAIVARIKILSNLKIDEARVPQDGRTQVTTEDGRDMDLRISTLPTIGGEKIVMRLQDRSKKIPALDELGIDQSNLNLLKKAIADPNGIVLTTGPTGSGKTTTLYSCLSILNTPDVNIMTIEDPVEIQMNGLNQSQVYPAINYTFAHGLRAALRQDPDIIMVGEIRDTETIQVAMEAALTGHLVLSTIHTNSAISTVTRILDMGVPAFLITATMNAIIAQRLVRKICPNCKKEVEVSPELEKKIRNSLSQMNEDERNKIGYQDTDKPLKIFEGEGCEKCGQTGYSGRIGIYEVLEMSHKIKEGIAAGANALEIEKIAISDGMKTLEHDGVQKILAGITTSEEVYSVARSSSEK